ncbi:HMCN1-like protein [Mya arenaria]|uniref:HMCN1-like protein n=1 Tax=Mya arenaria TaxID=6604 RepID=A0ABY7DBR4_MYAAR|nr:HMCN1-like protein [Mya arenaria]
MIWLARQVLGSSFLQCATQSTNATARPVDDLNAKSDWRVQMFLGGFSGRQCEIPPNFCGDSECKNGATCQNDVSNYTCICPFGFYGQICEQKAVNGNWSAWSGFTACSVTCGGGFMTRLRTCDSPKPDPEGMPCEGNNTETEICNVDECPKLKPPSQTGAIFDGHYDTIPCNEKNIERVKLEMTSKLSQMDCVKSGHCIAEMKAEECTGMRKRRPNRNGISLSILMKSSGPLSNDSFNIVDVMKNTSEPTSKLIDFIKQTIELEKTAQKLVNESVDFFQVTIDHQSHTVAPGPNGLTTSPHVFCPKGTAPLEVFCAESPIGTFSDGKSVIMCPTGQYQDEKGQESCKFCPKGTTTEGIGSINVTDCKPIETETQPEKKKPNTPDDTVSSALKIGVGVSLSILLLVMSALITVIARKKCRRVIYRNKMCLTSIFEN